MLRRNRRSDRVGSKPLASARLARNASSACLMAGYISLATGVGDRPRLALTKRSSLHASLRRDRAWLVADWLSARRSAAPLTVPMSYIASNTVSRLRSRLRRLNMEKMNAVAVSPTSVRGQRCLGIVRDRIDEDRQDGRGGIGHRGGLLAMGQKCWRD